VRRISEWALRIQRLEWSRRWQPGLWILYLVGVRVRVVASAVLVRMGRVVCDAGSNEGCCCLSRGHSKKEGAASALPASGRKLDLGEQLGQMLLEQSVDL